MIDSAVALAKGLCCFPLAVAMLNYSLTLPSKCLALLLTARPACLALSSSLKLLILDACLQGARQPHHSPALPVPATSRCPKQS